MADIRFPDDMVGKGTPLHDDDKVLLSDSQDSKAAKWWSLSVIRTWLENYFPLLDASNLLTTDLDAFRAVLGVALLTDEVNDLTSGDAYTGTDNNGFYSTTAATTNIPATNKVGILKVINSSTTKYLTYTTWENAHMETWSVYYDGTTWETWTKNKPTVLWTPDGTAGVVYTDSDGRVIVGNTAGTETLSVYSGTSDASFSLERADGSRDNIWKMRVTGVAGGEADLFFEPEGKEGNVVFRDFGDTISLKIDNTNNHVISTDFVLSSDARLKTEIDERPVPSIDGLIPQSFLINGNLQYGFIAQKMLNPYPELVVGTGKEIDGKIDYYRIKQNSIIAMLVKEIQKLKAKIN